MTTQPPTPRDAAAATVTAGASPTDAPTRQLYHMSRTAGVGLGDYAAVNVRAVVGLLLGVASVLALIFSDSYLPLIIPLAGIVVSVIALVQIRGSNGTQTGMKIAIAGAVLSTLLGGVTVAKQVSLLTKERAAQQQLAELIRKFSDASARGDGQAAYFLFGGSFREQVQLESFQRTLVSRQESLKIDHFELGPRVIFETTTSGALARATGLVNVVSSVKAPDGTPASYSIPSEFVIESGQWKIGDIRDYFFQQQQGQPRR